MVEMKTSDTTLYRLWLNIVNYEPVMIILMRRENTRMTIMRSVKYEISNHKADGETVSSAAAL